MRKLLALSLIACLLLAGCSLKEANAKYNEKEKTVHHSNLVKKKTVFQPKADISLSPITYQSTNVTISTVNRKTDVSEVLYRIWRTADGPSSMKTYTTNEKDKNFSILFDTKDFSSERGEYQIEAYSVNQHGKQELLGKSAVIFAQKVPILMYHAIDDYKGDGLKELFVTPANFEAQMTYLKDHGYTLLTFERWGDINKVNKPILVTFDDGMKNNLNALHILQKLKDDKFKPTATEFTIAGWIDAGSGVLSSKDIKEMAHSGIFSIQSHTMSHVELPKTTNYEVELKGAKEKLEQLTGKPVIAIAYPSGKFNDQVVAETGKYYQFAVTTKPGKFIETGAPNELLLMHRVRISYSTTMAQFAELVK